MAYPTEKHISSLKGDQFKFNHLSREILDNLLLDMELPNCFGIYGNWGSGKTTLMHFISTNAQKNPDVVTVCFDPWKYEYSENSDLVFALLNAIKVSLKLDKATLKAMASILLSFGAWSLKNFASSIQLDADIKHILETKKTVEKIIFEDHESWVDKTEKFKSEFNEIVKKGLKNMGKKKLILFIDDLDRCLPDNAVRLLEAIKNLLSTENTLFVLAIDKRVMSEMIQQKYDLHNEYGEEYLMKIIHYYYEMPTVKLDDMVEEVFKNHDLEIKEKTIRYISELLGEFASEPRKVKYYLHNFCTRLKIKKIIPIGTDNEYEWIMLFVSSYIISKCPHLFISKTKDKLLNIQESSRVRGNYRSTIYSAILKQEPTISNNDRKQIEMIFRKPTGCDYNRDVEAGSLFQYCMKLL